MSRSSFRFRSPSSEAPPSIPPVATCLNCGAEVHSKYCPECSQENEPLQLGVGHILRDALEEFAKFDSKLVNTLKPLLFKPGFLTQEWARGRRVGYISPFKLYLTSTFLFFLFTAWDVHRDSSAETTTAKGASTLAREGKSPLTKDDAKSGKVFDKRVKDLDPTAAFVVRAIEKLDAADQNDIADAVIEKLPSALFVLLPLFAFCLKIFYVRSGRYYVEHLVFALHNHAYFFLILSVVTLLPWNLESIGFAGCAIYSLLALKRYYAQGWPKTLVKALMLGSAYLFLLSIALLGALVAGVSAMPDETPVPPKENAKAQLSAPRAPKP